MADDDLLLASSDSDADTDDLIANSKTKPVAKKRLQKKASSSKKRKIPDADADDDDDDDDLFADDDEPKKPLSKREKIEALRKKKRQETGGEKSNNSSSKYNEKPSSSEKKDPGYESGDSYDSAQYVRTQEDNDFIDTEGDDRDAIDELYREQDFGDMRPDSDEEGMPSKKKRSSSGGSVRRRKADSDEDGEPDNPMMAAVHKMKKKKRVAKQASALDEEAKEFVNRMEEAADEDEKSIKEKTPAIKKLTMLSEVTDMLTKRDMMRHLLDNDILSTCKRWIQPLPNGSLGNVTVRQRIVEAISKMRGDNGILSQDLKSSGIGQVIMILYKHKSETPSMKRELKKLIEQWSRPIFHKSADMKDLEHFQHSRRDVQGLSSVAPSRRLQNTAHAANRGTKDIQSLIASGKTGIQREGLNRVRVPQAKGFQFVVRPQNKTGDVADKRMINGGHQKDKGGISKRGNLSKRMIEKGRLAGKNQRSANLSIEGRSTK
eukprot:CAMPEP_0194215612 /NCGR_PEP_ID=MMETSP0156-20130528/17557_1 /TAXON_ID=33649 /ORGANISM="Thalassionema nitzschioides, Strain L26-B" /LENGTH=489 /DNA_ID=CAMNT_0038944175 /DNA_START=34 /DNA_END=1503 /DNA_ORIENTATION=-